MNGRATERRPINRAEQRSAILKAGFMKMGEIITLRGLSKRYRPLDRAPAISEINLGIEEGEIFSLLGPNGAGKTTLISVLCGLFPPTRGDAIIAGRSVVRDPLGVKRIVGVVPEEVALYPQFSARKNLRYFGMLYGLAGRELDEAARASLAVVGLTDRGDEKVGRFSSGMKRRLNIAVGLLHKPRVLLMDEPTVGLDPESRRRILDLVRQLKQERGATILYTTHYVEEAEEISDRIGIIHQGRIVAAGAVADLIRAVQAEDVLRLEVGAAPAPAGALAAFEKLGGVSRVAREGDTITLAARAAAEALPEVLRIAAEQGLDVRSLTVSRPKLEAVFLALTGERLTAPP